MLGNLQEAIRSCRLFVCELVLVDHCLHFRPSIITSENPKGRNENRLFFWLIEGGHGIINCFYLSRTDFRGSWEPRNFFGYQLQAGLQLLEKTMSFRLYY